MRIFCGTVYYAVHGGSIFECVNDILKRGSYRAVLCCSTVYYAAQDSSITLSLWMKSCSVTLIKIKAIEQYFPVVLFIMLFKVVLTFASVVCRQNAKA